MTGSNTPLLEVRDLTVDFQLRGGIARAVDGVSFTLFPGEIVGLVGESGSGKSVTMASILRLVPPPGRIVRGEVRFKGRNLVALDRKALRQIRGAEIALIPADATASLNPVIRVGTQVLEGVAAHEPAIPFAEARRRMIETLRRVGLPMPETRAQRYPHELSGGMQQRTLIASALVLEPSLILADEPTTALDVTIQVQILRLLLEVRNQFGTTILYVTHDLATIAEICDRVIVMYAGHLVESAPVRRLFSQPVHPYTQALMSSVPLLGGEPPETLTTIAGSPPDPRAWPRGCRFAERCPLRAKLGNPSACETDDPPLREIEPGHAAACHFSGLDAATAVAMVTGASAPAAVGTGRNAGSASGPYEEARS